MNQLRARYKKYNVFMKVMKVPNLAQSQSTTDLLDFVDE